MSEMLNVAIFGGAFNPVHWGHLLIAETAFDQFNLDHVIWVPTFQPPHKTPSILAYEHRFEMVQRAIADHPAFTVSAVDQQRTGPSYAIDTLRALQVLHLNTRWHWIIGHDAFVSLPQWRASQELGAQCIWLVAPRPEAGPGSEAIGRPGDSDLQPGQSTRFALPHALRLRWHWLDMPSVGISSSLVRQRCLAGRSIRYLVPPAVHSYIAGQNLYQMS